MTRIDRSLLHHFLPWYPATTSPNFAAGVFAKAEFRFLENEPSYYLPHQIMIARFLSNYTVYDHLLVVHEMGTGKTLVALAAIEHIRALDPSFRIVFLGPSQTIVQNFLTLFDARLFPRNAGDDDHDTPAPTSRRRDAKFGLETFTYETFAKRLAARSDAQLAREYGRILLICDECHHLTVDQADDTPTATGGSSGGWNKRRTYAQLHRLMHLPQGVRKTMLMTGTPMRDQVSEIAPLLNLLLRNDLQLPTGAAFTDAYFERQAHRDEPATPRLVWRANMRNDLARRLQGVVSVYKQRLPDIDIVYEGEVVPPMQHWKIALHRMSEFQSTWYGDAWRRSTGGGGQQAQQSVGGDLYADAVQASLMILPKGDEEEGVWGEALFRAFLQLQDHKISFRAAAPWPADLRAFFLSRTISYQDKVVQLREYAPAYAAVIEAILERPEEVCYVYCSAVTGSGVLAFAAMLQAFFGFSLLTRAAQLANAERVGRRCLLLNAQTGLTDNEVPKLVRYVNEARNAEGEYCQVILSTNKTKEGVSFSHVRQVHIVTPAWNMADITQAMARGLRQGSHAELLRRGVRDVQVRIWLHCAVPVQLPNVPQQQHSQSHQEQVRQEQERNVEDLPLSLDTSIDFLRYRRSERKDENIQRVMRLLMEAAWDCRFWRERHGANRNDVERDGSRECQYTTCAYTCDGVVREPARVDYDTFDLYYDAKRIDDMYVTLRQEGLQTEHNVPLQTLFTTLEQRFDRATVRPSQWSTALARLMDGTPTPHGVWGLPAFPVYTSTSLSWTDDPVSVDPHDPARADAYVSQPGMQQAMLPDAVVLNEGNPHWTALVESIRALLLRTDNADVDATQTALVARVACLPSPVLLDLFQVVWPQWARGNAAARARAFRWLSIVSTARPGVCTISPRDAVSMETLTRVDLSLGATTQSATPPEWRWTERGVEAASSTTTSTTTTPRTQEARTATSSSRRRSTTARGTRVPPLTPDEWQRWITENEVGFYGIAMPFDGPFLIRHIENKDLFADPSAVARKEVPSGRACGNFQVKDLQRIAVRLWMHNDALRTLLRANGQRWSDAVARWANMPTAAIVPDDFKTEEEKRFAREHADDVRVFSKLPKSVMCLYLREAFARAELLQVVAS